MFNSTNGIVLHVTNYSETSIIAKLFTRSEGLQSFIVSGVRSKKSQNKAILFQPLSIVDVVFSKSKKAGLQRIKEISPNYIYTTVPYNITKSSLLIFINEVLYKSIREEHPDEDMFDFLKHSLEILDVRTESCANFHISFMIQLSRYLGFYPQGKYSDTFSFFDLKEGCFASSQPHHPYYLDPEKSRILFQLLNTGYENIHAVRIDKLQRKQVLQALILFYQLHLSGYGEMRSIGVLEEIAG